MKTATERYHRPRYLVAVYSLACPAPHTFWNTMPKDAGVLSVSDLAETDPFGTAFVMTHD